MNEKEYNKLTPFEKECMDEILALRKSLLLIVKHLEILNGLRPKPQASELSSDVEKSSDEIHDCTLFKGSINGISMCGRCGRRL